MNEFERRIRRMVTPLGTRVTRWWRGSARPAGRRRAADAAGLRHEASARARRAAARIHDLRDSERGKRAAARIHDLRDSGAAKRAEAALHDLRASDAGKRAENALADLRQRTPVKKAEERTRRVMHDLLPGRPDSGDGTGSAKAS